MTLELELTLAFRALLAAFLGGLVGWERYYRNKVDSEMRAFAAVSLGACTFGLVSAYVPFPGLNPTQISAQVVSGIGFLGAGIILKDSGRVKGLATAATLWASASIGLALAYGMYSVGILNAVIIFLVRHVPDWRKVDSTYRYQEPPADPPNSAT
jgi:putative Mg2+ transporter-C (MgtC) family protein